MSPDFLTIAPEVAEALFNRQPVVALESTIIAHGMPWPQNAETARRLEATVREHGAVPATIAVLKGQVHIGLNQQQLEFLAREKDVLKLSRRDMAHAIAARKTGATTVASTMMAASAAGIRVFATGGIGGVHRGAGETWDISADLTELAQTPVAVVTAGAKAILDLPKTLEYLETCGVPVIGFRTDEFPAFYSSSSGLPVAFRLDSERDVAKTIMVHGMLKNSGGVIIANPVPAEYDLSREVMEGYINQAVQAASREGVSGRELTPFLLRYIAGASGGNSLETNIALVLNNAALAARIAAELSRLNGTI